MPPETVESFTYNYTRPTPVNGHFEELDELRDKYTAFWSDFGPGFWVVLDPDLVREGYRNPELFSSSSVNVLLPNGPRYVPLGYDPPEHTQYRHVLNAWFSPQNAAKMEDDIRGWCRDTIAELVPEGGCELNTAFAARLPAFAFLSSVNLPLEDAPELCHWVEEQFHGIRGPNPGEAMMTYLGRTNAYFSPIIAARRAEPTDDFVSYVMSKDVGDRPITDEEILSILTVLLLAGLDTTRSELNYIFHHLATRPDDRARLVADPAIIPMAVEEFLRIYPIATGPGRQVTKDVEFGGCPMRKGDMVKFNLTSESRDPRHVDRPLDFDPYREVIRHNSFGIGPHRCLGAHLARRELAVALEEWHRQIPDYELDGEDLVELAPELGPKALPLRWAV